MRNAVVSMGMVVLAALVVIATPSASLAQPGSSGGYIGDTDRSVSGVRETHAPAIRRKPQQQPKDARVDVGSLSCTTQLERCISFRRANGPAGSEGICNSVHRACLRSGVWDATTAFPYGGSRITGMIRQ